ncbi:MAG: hypothetical protein P4M12_09180, partial [Gammaproteobacteria bacterium]|nr:hypothetical protein [Gammaproteobacteria bacterium]
ELVEKYRTEYGAGIDSIAQGYALAGNHERVEKYHGPETVASIAYGYAFAGNHQRVEMYRTQYEASVSSIPKACTHL